MTKKVFVELVELLEANANKKISTIMPQVMELVSSKVMAKTFVLDKDGEVFAIFCYYHKQWELVASTPYGKKASTATGLNSMCKAGTSSWTRQQRQAKMAKATLLDLVATGKVEPSTLPDKLALIEEARKEVVEDEVLGFPSIDDLPGFEDLPE